MHFFFKFFIVFFHYHLYPYMPSPLNHLTVFHAHESFSLFAQSLHPLTASPELPSALYESVPSLLVRSVCSLESTFFFLTLPTPFSNCL